MNKELKDITNQLNKIANDMHGPSSQEILNILAQAELNIKYLKSLIPRQSGVEVDTVTQHKLSVGLIDLSKFLSFNAKKMFRYED